jgi:hypothetical protein
MKKLIMFSMVLMLCLGFVGEAKADPDCVTICPTDAGPDDEITLTVYDEEGEFYDLTQITGGVSITFWEPDAEFYIEPGDPEMVDGSVVIDLGEVSFNPNPTEEAPVYCEMVVEGVGFTLGVNKEGPGFDHFPDAVASGGTCPEEIPVCRDVSSPIVIDPNVMLVYETGWTRGDFGIRMKNALPTGTTATVTVDPNLVTKDIRLLGGDPPDGAITMTFTAKDPCDPCDPFTSCPDWNPATRTSCWNVPLTVAFKAVDDLIAEPPGLTEKQEILVTSVHSEIFQDPNWAGEKIVKVFVRDNDQADILVTTPVWLKEEATSYDPVFGTPVYREVTVGVSLQVKPFGGSVEITVENMGKSGNQPIMDPPLTTTSDPNRLTFTTTDDQPWVKATMTSGWNVPQDIDLTANNDDVLQASGEESVYPSVDGEQDYQDEIVVTVVDDGGDARYTNLENTVYIDIEDNECGAFGISELDIANSSGEDEPDCYVDIYDIIEFATKWLDCSDPQGAGCESYL